MFYTQNTKNRSLFNAEDNKEGKKGIEKDWVQEEGHRNEE